MTDSPDSPFDHDPAEDDLAHEIKRALAQSTVEIRPEAQESAVAAALQAYGESTTQHSKRPAKNRWMLVAASIVVICVGVVGAFVATQSNSSEQFAFETDSAGMDNADESTAAAESSPEIYDSDTDASSADRLFTDEQFSEDSSRDTAQVPGAAPQDDSLPGTSNMESATNASLTLVWPTPGTEFLNQLDAASIGISSETPDGEKVVLSFGVQDSFDSLAEAINQIQEAGNVSMHPQTPILAASSTCIVNEIKSSLSTPFTIIGVTVIEGATFVVINNSAVHSMRYVVIEPQLCDL